MTHLQSARYDLSAAIVVFFVALPLCLGIALASGAPLVSGLVAGIVGGIVVGALSGSPLGVSGPAAGLTVIVLTSLETLGSFGVFLFAVVIAGVLQVGLGVLRAGVLGYFFPSAVIHGMLSGIGLIIVLKQIPYLLGVGAIPDLELAFTEVDGGVTSSAVAGNLGEILAATHTGAIVVSLTALALLVLWDRGAIRRHRILGSIPGPIVVVALGIGYQVFSTSFAPGWILGAEHLVSVPIASSLEELAGLLMTPDFSAWRNPEVYTVAATIAVVASLETLLSVEAVDKLDPQKRTTPTNRELCAQGVGNSVSGLLGGLPITQVIVRSSANVQAGARTRLSTIAHGVLLLVCVATLPGMLNRIPLGVLAAVLIVIGSKLARPALFQAMWQRGPDQLLPFAVTVAGVVLTDLLTGVGLGMGVAVLVILQRNYRNSHFLHIHAVGPNDERRRVVMRLAEEVTFLNMGAIKKELASLPGDTDLVLDQSRCVYVNEDVQEIIADFVSAAPARGIRVDIVTRQPPTDAPPMTETVRAAA